jgi:hypothetical protein
VRFDAFVDPTQRLLMWHVFVLCSLVRFASGSVADKCVLGIAKCMC